MLIVTVATLGLTIYLAVIIPKGLFPQQDTGLISGLLRGVPGHLVVGDEDGAADGEPGGGQRSRRRARPVVHGGAAGRRQHRHGVRGAAPPRRAQQRPPTRSSTGCARSWPRSPGINLFLQSVQDMRVGGRSSRTQYQYALQDADLDELSTWAPKVLAALRKLPELRDVNTDQQTAGIQLDVTVDRDSAARLGITMQMIDDTLYDAFGQRQVATSFTALNYYRVVLEATPAQQASPDQLDLREPAGAERRRRAGAAVEHREVLDLADAAVDQPPGAVAVRDAVFQPGARRRAGAGGHGDQGGRAADRPAGDGQGRASPGRPRPSAPRWPASPG